VKKACQDFFAIAIGKRIKELRTIRGWTQKELAVKVGSYKEIVNRLEHGKGSNPSIKTILKYAKAFQVTPELIIEVVEEQRLLDFQTQEKQRRVSVLRNKKP
jgi:transcriptional regulator with XRE-family HTH domain